MSEHDGGVRITNQRIYELVLDTRDEVRAMRGTMQDVVKPGLETAQADIRALKQHKADRTETTKLEGAINSVRLQAYAIPGGVIAGLLALRSLGVI